jgi:hypothetical protein
MKKQYAVIRLSDFELAKQAKIRAAQDGVSLLEVVQRALTSYINGIPANKATEAMEKISMLCGGGVDNDDRLAFEQIGIIAQCYIRGVPYDK